MQNSRLNRVPGSRCFATGTLLVLCAVVLAAPAAAQTPDNPDPVAEAERLRAARDFAGAARVLRRHVAQYADDVDAARLHAQSLYWAGDTAAARQAYETAIHRHPGHEGLRVDFGRMLLETGRYRRMHEVLAPTLAPPRPAAEAQTLVGTAAYWQGDYPTAIRAFESALRADPSRSDARNQLLEIASLTAPWFRLAIGGSRDDQPLDRGVVGAEAGWNVSPLTAFTARYQSGRIASGDSVWLTTMAGELGFSHYSPSSRLELEAAGGFAQRGRERTVQWTGRGGAGLRLPNRVTLRARGERFVSIQTLASLDTAIMGHAGAALVEWNTPRGWLAEAGLRREWYADANAISAAHAWLLAPIIAGPALTMQAGYGANAQSADESRYVADATTGGRYTPYYTPLELRSHSLLGAVQLRLTRRALFRANGSFGVRADEVDPAAPGGSDPIGGPPIIGLPGGGGGGGGEAGRRSFNPWTGRGSLEFSPTADLEVSLGAEAMHTAFYTNTSASTRITWRFGGWARRGAERRIQSPSSSR